MKKATRFLSQIIFYKPSKIGMMGTVLLGMIMGRIAAGIVINSNSLYLNVALFVIVISTWLLLFLRKIANRV